MIIVVVALALGALVVKMPAYVEKFYNYRDQGYYPKDLDKNYISKKRSNSKKSRAKSIFTLHHPTNQTLDQL